jgi:hypothetical protein
MYKKRKPGWDHLPKLNLRKVILMALADGGWKNKEELRSLLNTKLPADYVDRRIHRWGVQCVSRASKLGYILGHSIPSMVSDKVLERDPSVLPRGDATIVWRVRLMRKTDGPVKNSSPKPLAGELKVSVKLSIDMQRVSFLGKTQSLDTWAKELNKNAETLRSRLRVGWTVKRALTAPIRLRGNHTPTNAV